MKMGNLGKLMKGRNALRTVWNLENLVSEISQNPERFWLKVLPLSASGDCSLFRGWILDLRPDVG